MERKEKQNEGTCRLATPETIEHSPMVPSRRGVQIPDLERREKWRQNRKPSFIVMKNSLLEHSELGCCMVPNRKEESGGLFTGSMVVDQNSDFIGPLEDVPLISEMHKNSHVEHPATEQNNQTQNNAVKSKGSSNSLSICIVYGIINATIVIPVVMSFGSVIYHDEVFRPYLPALVKLTLASGMVHQICMSTFSSLPFAIGQVQDAGLIFLSAMATDISKRVGKDPDRNDQEHILATVTVGLSIATALLGAGLVLIGKFRLASYVQLLPTPVVGGYLAYIGFFCGQSGLSLMAGLEVSGFMEWNQFFRPDLIVLILPGIVCGIAVYGLVKSVKHMAVLPLCIVAIMIAFYLALVLMGETLDSARRNGWMNKADPITSWYETWKFLDFRKVVWAALPPQALTVVGMTVVVALSSALDVAAIELELKRPLDYNHELGTVGLNNIVSGFTGGYTGSYIFSQSIFSLRSGIQSRHAGYVVALCELIVVALPFSVLEYVPNFFFGSLMLMICFDLMYEWLWEVRLNFSRPAHGVAVSTFALIMCVGVEYGILLGITLHSVLGKFGVDLESCSNDPTPPIPMSEQCAKGRKEVDDNNDEETEGTMPSSDIGEVHHDDIRITKQGLIRSSASDCYGSLGSPKNNA